jgi:hypothetical protein
MQATYSTALASHENLGLSSNLLIALQRLDQTVKKENSMGFYGPEPFDTATATYVWMGLESPGAFFVEVKGHAPNYTSGITLVRDSHWVGGLKINVMGWTGPLGQGTTPYTVHHSFPGSFLPEIVVSGSNHTIVVKVKEIPAEQADDYLQKRAQAA